MFLASDMPYHNCLYLKSSFTNAQMAIIYFWTKIYFLIARKVNRPNGEWTSETSSQAVDF